MRGAPDRSSPHFGTIVAGGRAADETRILYYTCAIAATRTTTTNNIIKWPSHESDHPISIRNFYQKYLSEENKPSNKGYPKVHIKAVRSSIILSTMQLQISIIELCISVIQWLICKIIMNIHNSQQFWTSMIPLWIFVIVLWISIILSQIYIQ